MKEKDKIKKLLKKRNGYLRDENYVKKSKNKYAYSGWSRELEIVNLLLRDYFLKYSISTDKLFSKMRITYKDLFNKKCKYCNGEKVFVLGAVLCICQKDANSS